MFKGNSEMFHSNPLSMEIVKNHWQTCENCTVIFPVKAYQVHRRSCQGQKMIQEIILSQEGCIANGILYATVVTVKKEDFVERSKMAKKPVVLMHPSIMVLFKFRNGGPVLLHSNDDERVCRSWSCTNVGVGCVAFPLSCGLKWNPGDKVSVHRYEKVSDVAAKLYLFTESKEEYMSSERFKATLLCELDHMFVREGSTISVRYLGVPCEFSVLKVRGGRECRDEKYSYISKHYLKDLKPADELNQLTKGFSLLTIRDELHYRNKDTINCLLHCKPPSSSPVIPAEAEHQYDSASSQCKVHDYFVVNSHTTVSIETSREFEIKQRIPFDCVGSLQKQLHVIKVIIRDLLSRHYIENHDRLYTGVLLSGPSGTGKTLAARAIADECAQCDITFITVHRSELNNSQCEVNIAKVQEKFKEAVKCSPSILFIDNIDQILPKVSDKSAVLYKTRRLTDEVVDMIDGVMAKPHCAVLILATAKHPENIDPVVLKLKRIDKEINFDVPNSDARYEILKTQLSNVKHNLTDEQVKSVADTTEGYTGADLSIICRKASQHASATFPENLSELSEPVHIDFSHLTSSLLGTSEHASATFLGNLSELSEPVHIDFSHLTSALKEVKPSASKEFFFNIPKVKWSDIGGMHSIKEEVKEHFDMILNHADFWSSIGMTPPRGLLMYGPPGGAKTMIAMAVANEIKANFIPIKGPELLNKYVGESEKAVHKLFHRARCAAPCIIYFDDIDSIAIQRKAHEVSSRVLSQLFVEMSGIDPLEGVIVVASTNRPEMIDSALLRPGRFDKKIHIPLPDSLTRREILLMKLKDIPTDEINLEDLVERTEGYSCAEVVALCDKAIVTYIVGQTSSKTVAFMPLFHELLDSNLPRTSKELLNIYEKFGNKKVYTCGTFLETSDLNYQSSA